MNRTLLALALPILTLAGWVAHLEYNISSGQKVLLRIQGYDPRDLLAGHFVRFTLALGDGSLCPSPSHHTIQSSEDSCVCLTPEPGGTGFSVAGWSGYCSTKPSDCRIFIRGMCRGRRFDSGLDRYYIPEKLAPVLQTIPAQSSALISLSSKGKGLILKLFVEDEPIENYAERKMRESPPSDHKRTSPEESAPQKN